MVILQMLSNMKKNGPAMVVYDLAYGLAEMGHDVYIAAGEGELAHELSHPKIHYIHIPIDKISGKSIKTYAKYMINGIKTYYQLKRLILDKKIEIINSHQPVSNIFAKRLSHVTGIPFVTTSHNVYKKNILSKTYVSGNHVIACSDKVYENSIAVFKVPQDKITCIRNGINPDRLKITEELNYPCSFVIGTLAGLRKQKALDKLIKAFSVFHESVKDSCLVIAGDGSEKESLILLTKELNIEDYVLFLGFRSDSANVLSGLNIFALSSEFEGLPISMLEAMVMKIPVVVTPVGGIPWVIKDKNNGILCSYGNVVEMADAFFELYKSSEYRKEIGLNGYNTVIKQYSSAYMAQQYLQIYQKQIADN